MAATSRTKSFLIIFFVVLIGLLFRRYDGFTRPQIYAEDGPVFLEQFMELGIKSLWTPYAGYLHTMPRLIALLFGYLGVDLLYIPICYDYSYFVLCLLVAWEIWRGASYMNIKHKVFYATIFLFIPVGPEMFMNITNSIWVTSLYLVNFLLTGYKLYEAEKWKPLKLLLLLAVSLTGPYSLLLSPIILLIFFLERKTLTINKVVPLCVILLGGMIQTVFIKFLAPKQDRSIPGTPEPLHFIKYIKYNIRDLAFARDMRILTRVPERAMTIICLCIFAFLCYLLYKNYRRINISRRYVLVLAPIVYIGSCVAVFWPMETCVLAFNCPRYYFVPYTCFAWIFILGWNRILNYTHIALYFIYFILQKPNMRYTLDDKEWKREIMEYKAGKREAIDIQPAGWSFRLPPYKK